MIRDVPDFPRALEIAKGEILCAPFTSPTTFEQATKIICRAMELLIISKNHKYGKQNINDLGGVGIFCRTYDKTSRLKSHYIDKKDLGSESVLDTWGDLCGYGMVGVLKENEDWYSLPLGEQ